MNVELEEGFSKSLFEVIHTADDLRRVRDLEQKSEEEIHF